MIMKTLLSVFIMTSFYNPIRCMEGVPDYCKRANPLKITDSLVKNAKVNREFALIYATPINAWPDYVERPEPEPNICSAVGLVNQLQCKNIKKTMDYSDNSDEAVHKFVTEAYSETLKRKVYFQSENRLISSTHFIFKGIVKRFGYMDANKEITFLQDVPEAVKVGQGQAYALAATSEDGKWNIYVSCNGKFVWALIDTHYLKNEYNKSQDKQNEVYQALWKHSNRLDEDKDNDIPFVAVAFTDLPTGDAPPKN